MKLLLIIFSFSAYASFLPKNTLIYPSKKTKKEFGKIKRYQDLSEDIIALYDPLLFKLEARLLLDLELNNDRVNAYARRDEDDPKIWRVVLTGGLLRHPKINDKRTTPIE